MLVEIFQILCIAFGIFTALAVIFVRRFGSASWLLGSFLLLETAIPGVLIFASHFQSHPTDWFFRLIFGILLFSSPLVLLFAWLVDRHNYSQIIAKKGSLLYAIILPVPLLVLALYLIRPAVDSIPVSEELIAMGPGGYLASLYLLITAIMTLSRLEQVIRAVEEKIKWGIKFLFLGLAANCAAVIYLSTKTLLYSFRYAFLPKNAFDVFTLVFPVSCILILISWNRNSGKPRIPVSQNFVYGSITLLSVGTYLILSALFARWVSIRGAIGSNLQPAIFLLSIIALVLILLWTSFRHRVRDWIRRNLLAGKYDYRQFWLEASEQIRSVDGQENSAMALARIIQRAMGAIDISVWLREQDPEVLKCSAVLGNIVPSLNLDLVPIIPVFEKMFDPVTVEEINRISDNASLKSFAHQTKAALIMPLFSSDLFIGILTVGSDRSGRLYDREARDFLRVLANHAASEFHKHKLLATLVAAKEAEAFKTFSTFLLHDLKNFASTLSLLAKNASRHQDNPDFQRDAFQSIFDTAEKMKRLCNNLRAFSSNFASNRRLTDLNGIVRDLVKNLNGSCRLHVELRELPAVFIDPEDIGRVIHNILLNAREAVSSDGEITVRTTPRKNAVELTVEDNGIGMTREFMEKELYQPFHTTKSEGLGIGLFQCKKIIEAHEGHISIKSELGKGTAVSIIFPLSSNEILSCSTVSER